MSIDLRTCKPGDILISKHGMELTYVKALPEGHYMDHEVKYPNGSYGTRTHDGFVFRKKRLEEDHDIVEIRGDGESDDPGTDIAIAMGR